MAICWPVPLTVSGKCSCLLPFNSAHMCGLAYSCELLYRFYSVLLLLTQTFTAASSACVYINKNISSSIWSSIFQSSIFGFPPSDRRVIDPPFSGPPFSAHPVECRQDRRSLVCVWPSPSQLPDVSFTVGFDIVKPVRCVLDLGIYLDSDLSMRTHVSNTVASCFAALRQIRNIQRSVSRPVLLSLLVSLILSRLYYGTSRTPWIPVT